jgi:hypothetical protein
MWLEFDVKAASALRAALFRHLRSLSRCWCIVAAHFVTSNGFADATRRPT